MIELDIKVNGEKIPLTEFPSEIISNTIQGMVQSLKGVEDIETVEISLKKM